MNVKSRDVEDLFRNMGSERATIFILREIIEFQVAVNQQMNELTAVTNKLIDLVGTTASGYANMRKQIERVQRKVGEDDLKPEELG